MVCDSEEEARSKFDEQVKRKRWPCYFFNSDTTGEKSFEEFFTLGETLELRGYQGIGVIKNKLRYDVDALLNFESSFWKLKQSKKWSKSDLVKLVESVVPEFEHLETGKYLDGKM